MTQSLENTPSQDRYLTVLWQLSEDGWQDECRQVCKWLNSWNVWWTAPKAARRDMLELICRPLTATELPLVIHRCYADIPEGITWDLAFDLNDVARLNDTRALLRFGVIFHRTVNRSLAHGWHQLAVIDFPDGIPDLISELPVDADEHTCGCVGLCNVIDFEAVNRGRTELAIQSKKWRAQFKGETKGEHQ
jgi:hypothetical protein